MIDINNQMVLNVTKLKLNREYNIVETNKGG